MFNIEKLSGSFLRLLLSVMQATITKMMLQPSYENTMFCMKDPRLGTTFLSLVLSSSFDGANVVDDGKYLKPANKNFRSTAFKARSTS